MPNDTTLQVPSFGRSTTGTKPDTTTTTQLGPKKAIGGFTLWGSETPTPDSTSKKPSPEPSCTSSNQSQKNVDPNSLFANGGDGSRATPGADQTHQPDKTDVSERSFPVHPEDLQAKLAGLKMSSAEHGDANSGVSSRGSLSNDWVTVT